MTNKPPKSKTKGDLDKQNELEKKFKKYEIDVIKFIAEEADKDVERHVAELALDSLEYYLKEHKYWEKILTKSLKEKFNYSPEDVLQHNINTIKSVLNVEHHQGAINAIDTIEAMTKDGIKAYKIAIDLVYQFMRMRQGYDTIRNEPKRHGRMSKGVKKTQPNRAQKLDEICRTHVLGYLLSWGMTAKQMIEFLTGAAISEYIPRTPTDITARVITPRKLSNAQQLEFTATIDGIKTKHRYNLEYFTDKLPHHERQNQRKPPPKPTHP